LLREYYANESGRQQQVRLLFDASADDYDRVNALMSLGSGQRYRADALRRIGLCSGERLLDCGAGTGAISAAAQKMVGTSGLVVALDPSSGMLAHAAARGVRYRIPARAERLPFASASFDRLTMGYALRHVADLAATFAEYARVLVPGGSVLLLEITPPSGRLGFALLRFYMRTLVPFAARWLGQKRDTVTLMRYYWDTIESCVPPATILAALRSAGFESVQRRIQFGIFSEYTAVKPA
jgi:demethylmenaquinone methyltransferase/2-methoxy-6-polyprenyl-1,4-benzoquinol methylase